MLVSLNRVGGARQAVAWSVAVLGPDSNAIARTMTRVRPPSVHGQPLEIRAERTQGLYTIRAPLVWLGGLAARDEVFAVLGRTAGLVAEAARSAGAVLLPAGVTLGGPGAPPAVLGGDVHELEVLDVVEQEVLCNLLRRHAAVLIAYAGRGIVGPGRPPDRVGSRWLTESGEHLATRYLRSASPWYLEHVQAELRRAGVARLDRMDVFPRLRRDGVRTVVVRCLDAQAPLSVTRSFTVLLGALAAHARRLVRDGYREEDLDQRALEKDRSRALATGPRAVLGAGSSRGRGAAAALRALLVELRRAHLGLEVTSTELAPLLAAIDLPPLDVPYRRVDDLLRMWAAEGPQRFHGRLLSAMCDGRAGGVVYEDLYARHPGKLELVLDSWDTELALSGGTA